MVDGYAVTRNRTRKRKPSLKKIKGLVIEIIYKQSPLVGVGGSSCHRQRKLFYRHYPVRGPFALDRFIIFMIDDLISRATARRLFSGALRGLTLIDRTVVRPQKGRS